MAIELRQQLKLSQQLIMTPQLQMAIKMLQLSRQELQEIVSEQLEENPTLEEKSPDESVEEPLPEQVETPMDDGSPEREVPAEEKIVEDIDWSQYFEESGQSGKTSYESETRETPSIDTYTAYKESLNDHLLWQLLMTAPSPEEEIIGSLIAGNLSPDGWLDTSLEELVELSGSTPETVEQVLSRMQEFDPIGVCARNLGECLRIQARHFNLDDTIVISIIDHYLSHVENRNYRAIAKALKVSMEDVSAALEIIRDLEPRPGRQFSEEEIQYIEPDIYVYEYENDFRIALNDDGMPKLRINNFYKDAMIGSEKVSEEAKEYIQDKIRSAHWLIRSIQQRQETIELVMESILKFQREFFEKGVLYLKPMVLRDVALDIDKHESTISRVTTNKYAYTPRGIFELKYFFNSSINRGNGDTMASVSVQEKIRRIIEKEDPAKPYSDLKIANMLKADTIDIARRTVAKYREMMNILPSNKRKRSKGGF